jgi:hypothetical protein
MKSLRMPLEVSLGMVMMGGLLVSVAVAQPADSERSQPGGPAPPTSENRSGLPPAPPEIVQGSGSRGLMGNDTPDPTTPPRTIIIPKDRPVEPKQ